jgi:hypothetical protein
MGGENSTARTAEQTEMPGSIVMIGVSLALADNSYLLLSLKPEAGSV